MEKDTSKLSIQKLRTIGLLWCEGDEIEKASELYESLQDEDAEEIACNDKDFKPTFHALLDFATQLALENEPIYMKTPEIENAEDLLWKSRDKYDDLFDEFIDSVFGNESRL